eukprot:7882014-Pyramimonas_sp.AAC.1
MGIVDAKAQLNFLQKLLIDTCPEPVDKDTGDEKEGDDEGIGDKPLRPPKETTSPLEDYLWRGDDPVLKDMLWYVYSMWVCSIEKPEKKFKKDGEPAKPWL